MNTPEFKIAHYNNNPIGLEFVRDGFIYFFGMRDVSFEVLQKNYANLDFHFLRQTHSTKLVSSSTTAVEADAHWTDSRKTALRISTADCLPVLVSHPDFVCAIHAGWRGVHSGIIPLSMVELKNKYGDLDKVTVAIGPHILRNSFEVDFKLADEIKQNALAKYQCPDPVLPSATAGKCLIDLLLMARHQLQFVGINEEQIITIPIDTKTDERFHSFRREKSGGTRNYSFIARL